MGFLYVYNRHLFVDKALNLHLKCLPRKGKKYE